MTGFPAPTDFFRRQTEEMGVTVDADGDSSARQAIKWWVLEQGSGVVAILGCRTSDHVIEIFR